jgi:carbamoyltransferase
MILVDDIRKEWKDQLQNVVHLNDTSRVQTVTADVDPKYRKLLEEFKKQTGIGMLLNTSFNKRGMPIVETPVDAIDFFFSCELDVLVIGNYIVTAERREFTSL